jgi:hypothetical protein
MESGTVEDDLESLPGAVLHLCRQLAYSIATVTDGTSNTIALAEGAVDTQTMTWQACDRRPDHFPGLELA